jgi:hypothetical protein
VRNFNTPGYLNTMSARTVYGICFILALTAAYACWCRAPMIWDGAYQFNATLIMQQPYYYLTRFHTYLLWWPTVWASRLTSNTGILQAIYGLPFLLAPLLAVVLSWWMVHKHAPHLILWVIFGVAAGSLPGQIFVINDSIFQQHLFWPIFMGMLVPLTWPKRIVIAILAVFQFVHPLGVALFFGAMVAMLCVAAVDRKNRRRNLIRAGIMLVLFGLTTSKIIITNHIPSLADGYAADEARLSTAIDRWSWGVRGWPLQGLWFMWAAAAMLFIRTRLNGRLKNSGAVSLAIALAAALALMAYEYRRAPLQGAPGALACIAFFAFVLQYRRPGGPSRIIALLPILCIIVATVCWIHWASDGSLWWKAIDYRRWVGPLTAPFFLLATLDAMTDALWRNRGGDAIQAAEYGTATPKSLEPNYGTGPQSAPNAPALAPKSLRDCAGLILAATFAIVLGLQCTVYHRDSEKMMAQVMQYPASVVPESALGWIAGTPLDHWAVSDYVTAMQGKTPMKLLLDPRSVEHIYENPPKVPHWDFYPGASPKHPDVPPGPVGWFDMRPLLKKLKTEPRPADLGPERLDAKTTPE